jgi:cytosine/adenosine deaminase-related metal-dependent hydrolase
MLPRAIHADALVTGDAGIVRDGAVVVDQGGRILDVGAAADVLPRHSGAPVERVHGAVLPGLVNAHTHIELSALRGQVPGGAGFVAWVERLLGARSELDDDIIATSLERAVGELDAFGTVAVGDVSNTLAAVQLLARTGIGGSVFHEVFGLRRAAVLDRVGSLARLRDEAVGAWPTSDLSYAPAPHTLYTTHPDAVRALLTLARALGARSTLHLAEHPGERRALEHGDGPVVDWLVKRTQLRDEEVDWPHCTPIDVADTLGALAPDVLAVHLTDARFDELARIAERDAPVVLCPRSNLYIEVKLPPLIAVRAAGIEPALGTDSLASNASLDVLAEARALADRFPAVPARDFLRMATWNGARALGRADLGRIATGARPGLLGILGDPGTDAASFILANVRAPRQWIARRSAKEGGA